jgi:nitrogen fixation/metabolism regulation signal transduction histidine kinase
VQATSDDEIGFLVGSFNQMIRDLRDARSGIERSATELERRRRYMEIVLGTVGAGVVSVDAEGGSARSTRPRSVSSAFPPAAGCSARSSPTSCTGPS